MKEKLELLAQLAQETIGASFELSIMKDKRFRMKILQGNTAKAILMEPTYDVEKAIDESIQYIQEKRRPVTFNDIKGTNSRAQYSLKRELVY